MAGKPVVVQEVRDAGCEAGLMVREAIELPAERIGKAKATQLPVDEAQATKIAATEIRTRLKEPRRRLSEDRWQVGKGLSGDQS